MISTFTAIIDANVFYSARLRSFLLFQAQAGGFRARWTREINEEWKRNLLANRPELDEAKIVRTITAMNTAVLDCIVDGHQSLIGSLDLPDPNDRHVLAAAIVAPANVIVTFNLKHFPNDKIEPYGLHAKHPDDFLLDLASIDPVEFVKYTKKDFKHYVRNPPSFDDYIESLRKSQIPKTASYLKQYRVLIA